MNAVITHKEADRLEALERLQLMDTPAEPEFDELVMLAAEICGVPISLISLIDERRQWFKAVSGLAVRETDREVAFCSHTIQQSEAFVVEDAVADSRFAKNPLVTGEPNIRFYAGIPITSPDGFAMGSLCVIDRKPRHLSKGQLDALAVLGRQVNARMELRLKRKQLEEALREKERANKELRFLQERFRVFMDSSPFLSFIKTLDGKMVYYNRPFAERFNISSTEWLGKNDFEIWPANNARAFRANDLTVLKSGKLQVSKEHSREADGTPSLWRLYKFPCANKDGLTMLGCIAVDVTETMANERALERMQMELQTVTLRLDEAEAVCA